MSAEWARAAVWSLPFGRSGPSPLAARTWFIALRIRLSEARENWAADPSETTESATKTAAQSAATCVGERIGGHSEGPIGRSASPKRGIWGQRLPFNANFGRAQLRPKQVLLPKAGRVRATLRATETPPRWRPEAPASRRFRRGSPRRGAAPRRRARTGRSPRVRSARPRAPRPGGAARRGGRGAASSG